MSVSRRGAVAVFLQLVIWLSFSSVSYGRDARMRIFAELDKSLKSRPLVQKRFEGQMDSLRRLLTLAETDSTRWMIADRLFKSYRYNNIDSAQHYVRVEYTIAHESADPHYRTLAELNEIMLLCSKNFPVLAEQRFQAVDTSLLHDDRQLLLAYLSCGNSVYGSLYNKALGRFTDAELIRKLNDFRLRYYRNDSLSCKGARLYAQFFLDKGAYERGIGILLPYVEAEPDLRLKGTVAYYLAKAYERLGNRGLCEYWMAVSSLSDLRSGSREYLSLCELALMLYEDGDLKRAEKYISTCFSDFVVFSGNSRMVNTGQAQLVISKARLVAGHRTTVFLIIVVSFMMLMLLGLLFMFRLSFRQQRQLKKSRDTIVAINTKLNEVNRQLQETNTHLLETNRRLQEANTIKENYVFRYMNLSSTYLGNLEKLRISLRSLAKKKGVDTVMKKLRMPLPLEEDYKRFYHIFDETFLNMFPDFVAQVNMLLDESGKFPETQGHSLATGLRIFALIRLGIKESGQIAIFLNRSATTIYTYRTKIKRHALCPKEEFESRICEIGI